MEFDLITEADYDSLPDEPDLKFVALEQACRRGMNRLISQETSPEYDGSIRLQYMAMVSSAADELGISGITYPSNWDEPINGYGDFNLQVSGVITRIRLRSRNHRTYSVRLSNRTKGKIELQIRRLRETIEKGEMAPSRRQALLKRLDELLAEVSQPRASFAKVMSLVAAISVGVAAGTSFLADAPDAIATITSLIGEDKEAEDKETERLGAPVMALPAPTRGSNAPAFEDTDDIPF